jgi:phage gp29-like protein
MEVFSEALPKLVGIGFKIPRTWAHEKLGIPEPADDKEPVLELAQPKVMQAACQYHSIAALNQQLKPYIQLKLLHFDLKPYLKNSATSS